MPRLLGIVEYRFVQPWVTSDGKEDWRHPDGWKFTVVRDPVAEEAHAERAETWLRRCEQQALLCAELGHEHDPGGCLRRIDAEWACERWLRLSRAGTRNNERTMLVRIEHPI